MGAVDLVIQVESPGAVSRGLQRIGRAGHQVGEPSKGTIFPKHRGDLLEAAVVTRRMLDGLDRVDPLPAQPARRAGPADRGPRRRCERRARSTSWPRWCAGAPASPSSPTTCSSTCSTCSPGRYPSEEFGELRPRIVWDRVERHAARPRRLASGWPSPAAAPSPTAACSACSCPTAPGSASSTRRWSTRAGPARRSCSARPPGASRTSPSSGSPSRPAPGQPGKMPFWHGDRPGRPLELGRALGAFVREIRELPPAAAIERAA